jgi:hypothetical protein
MQKNLKPILGWIIILLLLVSSSIFYTALRKSVSDIRGLKQKNTELENENKDLKQKLLLGWKEYIDEKNGYKIWYPEELLGFKISMREDDANNRSFVFSDQSLNTTPLELFKIRTYSKNEPDIAKIIQEDVKKELENNLSADTDKYINNIAQYIAPEKINNIDAYKVEIPESIINYYIKRGNLVFVLSFNSQLYPPEDSNIIKPYFERMAQNFKFIE